MIQQVMRAVRGGEYVAPKTILGFLGSIAGIAVALAIGLSFALAGTSSLHFLIVGIVLFVVILLCAVVVIVVYFAASDPSKLQLGQVSAKDYIAIQSMGDDTYGEYVELPGVAPRSSDQSTDPPQILPPDEETPE